MFLGVLLLLLSIGWSISSCGQCLITIKTTNNKHKQHNKSKDGINMNKERIRIPKIEIKNTIKSTIETT